MLARTFSRPRCAMPMTTSSRPACAAADDHRVEQRDERLAALQREPLLPDVLGLQERLERLGAVEPPQDVQLLLARRACRAGSPRAPGSRPAPPGPGCACTRCRPCGSTSPQHAEDVAQLHRRLAAEPAGRELALQVPQGEPVLEDVEVGVAALLVLQRVGVGHQVAADPVGVDQLVDAGDLGDVVLVARRRCPAPSAPARTGCAAPRRSRRRSRPRRAAAGGCGAGSRRTARPG